MGTWWNYAEGVGQLQPRVSYPGIESLDIGQTLKEFATRALRWQMFVKSQTLSELQAVY